MNNLKDSFQLMLIILHLVNFENTPKLTQIVQFHFYEKTTTYCP
jgi:hypothetical protein